MESHVGCYETGSLDFFGPLCVVACYVDQKDEKELNELGLDKEMSTNDIEKIGKDYYFFCTRDSTNILCGNVSW